MYPKYWIPRSIRAGERELPTLRNDFTANDSAAKGAIDWVMEAISLGRISFEDFQMVYDQYGIPDRYVHEFLGTIDGSSDANSEELLKEIIDYVLFNTHREIVVDRFNRYTALSQINWQASPVEPYQLIQRVLPEVEQNYLECVSRAGDAASKCLREAWGAAYGATPEPMQAWREAVRAVETLLAPVVAPTARLATLGSLKSTLRQGLGNRKWLCTLPVKDSEDPCAKFLQLLEMLQYEPSRHNAEEEGPSVEAARGQVQLSLAICQIILDEGFKRNDEVLDGEGV